MMEEAARAIADGGGDVPMIIQHKVVLLNVMASYFERTDEMIEWYDPDGFYTDGPANWSYAHLEDGREVWCPDEILDWNWDKYGGMRKMSDGTWSWVLGQ